MQMRRCGKSNVRLPIIGFGSMRMHGDDVGHWAGIVREAMLAGFTYVDAGNTYCSWTNETKIGLGIKGLRDKVVLSTKCSGRNNPTASDVRPGSFSSSVAKL